MSNDNELIVPISVSRTVTETQYLPVELREMSLLAPRGDSPAVMVLIFAAKDEEGDFRDDVPPISFRREGEGALQLLGVVREMAREMVQMEFNTAEEETPEGQSQEE